MSREHLATYLNDHLAGAVAAVELLDNLSSSYKDTDIPGFVAPLKTEIEADRLVLEDVMGRLGIEPSSVRRASAWFASKMTELKLLVDDPASGSLHLFQAFEILSLGIEGKRALWLALAAASERATELKLIDYNRMIARAVDQRNRVEERRLESAQNALLIDAADRARSGSPQ